MSETIKPKYNLGDAIYWPSWDQREKWAVCPCCNGNKSVIIVYGDGVTARLACAECDHGFMGITGEVSYYEREPKANKDTITGIELRDGKYIYHLVTNYLVEEDQCFLDAESALVSAKEQCSKFNPSELERVKLKHKDNHTWAWNASYYRKRIKEAQSDLTFYQARLVFAKEKITP